jgi:hypothetical protein
MTAASVGVATRGALAAFTGARGEPLTFQPALSADASPSAMRASVVVLHDLATLCSIIPAWEELAANALEPNAFYEHWMLLPALQAFGVDEQLSIVLVLLHDLRNPVAPPRIGGLFPLQRVAGFKGLPLPAYTLWRHPHCYLCTPLVRADYAYQTLNQLFDWLREADGSVLEWGQIGADGPFQTVLAEVARERGLVSRVTASWSRGLLRKGVDNRVPAVASNDFRRSLQRRQRRLSELGRVESVALQPGDDIATWMDAFLQLEASGWKGRRGSALACSETNSAFFRAVMSAAFRRGRLMMSGLDLNGTPIARECDFIAGEGSFAFKTAYDERYARFAPGVMLEVENIRQLNLRDGVQWMDSCTAPENQVINRLWNARRTVHSVAIGVDVSGELVLSALPVLRWLGARIRESGAGKVPARAVAAGREPSLSQAG